MKKSLTFLNALMNFALNDKVIQHILSLVGSIQTSSSPRTNALHQAQDLILQGTMIVDGSLGQDSHQLSPPISGH